MAFGNSYLPPEPPGLMAAMNLVNRVRTILTKLNNNSTIHEYTPILQELDKVGVLFSHATELRAASESHEFAERGINGKAKTTEMRDAIAGLIGPLSKLDNCNRATQLLRKAEKIVNDVLQRDYGIGPQ